VSHDVPEKKAAIPRSEGPSEIGTDCWLTATAVRLPATVQSAAQLNAALHRPSGWLESRAGIYSRHVWAEQDPLEAAAEAARDCLKQIDLLAEEVGALLVTSEAPPLLAGLAAALHHRLDLRPETVALEIGGACTGFLSALWTAQALLPRLGTILLLAVEAPSRFLNVRPGPDGEAAALFGDAAAVCVLSAQAVGKGSVPVHDILLGSDGSAGEALRIVRDPQGAIELHMDGIALAQRAVGAMAQAVTDILTRNSLSFADITAIIAHGGNGRMPALLARRLGLPAALVWSETEWTGNLGSTSLPVAWAVHGPGTQGKVIWTAAGAGLTWGSVLTG
jgi:3-oxoacyl-[acyl-carrier-protein] synthase-3